METLLELLVEILGGIAELVLESFLELFAAAILDVVTRASRALFTNLAESVKANRVLTGFIYVLLGAMAGALSLLVLPHPIMHLAPRRFHGISLLISPIITGLVLSSVGGVMRRWGKKVTPIATFRYGFAFALGMALMRFFYAK